MNEERRKVLDEYVVASRSFAEAVERLRQVNNNSEQFIRTLDETGTAHRACERCRIKLNKLLARPA